MVVPEAPVYELLYKNARPPVVPLGYKSFDPSAYDQENENKTNKDKQSIFSQQSLLKRFGFLNKSIITIW
jgi:hypothetical protein